ncbi:hypothetical protein J1605_018351 [Eschrichtius robustus]|uniref:Uncharacterized protein n=1 Tax=Eschrichtius robustus TaxID=9764 RepID=A0AB34HWG7_ESCRO|nr:hypothetical protein J1605_018351 [Eschrichtius robustus]
MGCRYKTGEQGGQEGKDRAFHFPVAGVPAYFNLRVQVPAPAERSVGASSGTPALPPRPPPPTPRNPPQGGGAGAEALPPRRPGSNKPERQPRLRESFGAENSHGPSLAAGSTPSPSSKSAPPASWRSTASLRTREKLARPNCGNRSDPSSTTVSAPSSPRAPPAWAARPLGPIFCGSTAPVSLFCDPRAPRPSSRGPEA